MSKPSKRIPNREAFERMNFLYQVRVVDSMLARTVASQSQQASIQSKYKYDWKKKEEKKKSDSVGGPVNTADWSCR